MQWNGSALPCSFIEAMKARGKFNAMAVVAFLSHEEGVVVLIQQPRLQIAANTRDDMGAQTHGVASKPESFKELPIP